MLQAGRGAEVVETARGRLEIWQAAPGVVVQRVIGHATKEVAAAIAAYNGRLIARGQRPLIFNDWEALVGYDSDARIALTAWTVANKQNLRGIHVLLKSKIVAMGISVSNLATGGIITAYTSRPEFERALAEASRMGTVPPPAPGKGRPGAPG